MAGQVRKVQHHLQISADASGIGPVGLVHGEQVGHLQQPRLVGLDSVAHSGGDHDQHGVGRRGHIDLHLSNPDCLDHHWVEPGQFQHPDHAGHR